jgi:hypothetical protein
MKLIDRMKHYKVYIAGWTPSPDPNDGASRVSLATTTAGEKDYHAASSVNNQTTEST